MIIIIATHEPKSTIAAAATRTQNTTHGSALKQQVTKATQTDAVRKVAANFGVYDPMASRDWESLAAVVGLYKHDNHNHSNYILIQRGAGARCGRDRISMTVGQIPWAHAYGKPSQN